MTRNFNEYFNKSLRCALQYHLRVTNIDKYLKFAPNILQTLDFIGFLKINKIKIPLTKAILFLIVII